MMPAVVDTLVNVVGDTAGKVVPSSPASVRLEMSAAKPRNKSPKIK